MNEMKCKSKCFFSFPSNLLQAWKENISDYIAIQTFCMQHWQTIIIDDNQIQLYHEH